MVGRGYVIFVGYVLFGYGVIFVGYVCFGLNVGIIKGLGM